MQPKCPLLFLLPLLTCGCLTAPISWAQQESNGSLANASANSSPSSHQHFPNGAAPNERRAVENQEASGDLWSMVAQMNEGSRAAELDEIRFGNTGQHLKYDWDMNLDKLGKYRLSWRVNYPANCVTFSLELEQSERSSFRHGRDLFALGFSQDGKLKSSDFCLIWFDLGHKIHLQDARTTSNSTLELLDESESACKLLASSASKSRTEERVQEDNLLGGHGDHGHEDGHRGGGVAEEHEFGRAASQHDRAEIVFERQLDVCNESAQANRHYRIDNGTTNLVWFALRGPVLALDGLNLDQLADGAAEGGPTSRERRGRAGSFEFGLNRVQLIASRPRRTAPRTEHIGGESSEGQDEGELWAAESSQRLDILMDNYRVPSSETTYWCKLFKLPARFETRRYHITSYGAAIKPGNEHVVHHMELFNCATPDARELASLYSAGGWSGECSSPRRPHALDSCRRVILAWAMGARPLVYPDQVGQSIGGAAYNPYVVLEVHYNNVGRVDGLLDSSGLRFHYTARLRQFDAGVLEVGLEYTDKNSIPPRMITPLAGHCVGECTRVAMAAAATKPADGHPLEEPAAGIGRHQLRRHDRHGRRHHKPWASPGEAAPSVAPAASVERGIYIFAAQMHTHLTGVASWTEQVRAGRLVREIQRDDHYSPHFQEIRLLAEPVLVEPGDALIHYCLYDTTKRANVTLGGFATNDEMCVTYVHYYPKIDLEVCKSSVDSGALRQYFGYLAREEAQPTSAAANKSVAENYRAVEWSARRARELVEFYANAPLSVECLRSNGQAWPGAWTGVGAPRVWRPSGAEGPLADGLPYSSAWSTTGGARSLAEYRGLGAGRRHEQCSREVGQLAAAG